MQIDNNVALISGGGSGMGAASARLLASKGAKVCLLDVNYTAAKAVADDINGLAIECNVCSSEEVERAVAEAARQIGVARICINCAGIAPAQRIVGRKGPMSLEDFSHVININLIGSFNLMRIAAAAMIELEPLADTEERGIIINTASVAAFEGQLGQAAYSASKGGIVSLTLPAAREFAKFGIRVNAIAPGLIETPMLLNMSQFVQDSLLTTTLFPKRLGKPEEYAELVAHMISNVLLNGCVIRLDGAVRLPVK